MKYRKHGYTDQEIADQATKLCRMLLESGYTLDKTGAVQGIDVDFYVNLSGKVVIQNIIAGWIIERYSTLKPFEQSPASDERKRQSANCTRNTPSLRFGRNEK